MGVGHAAVALSAAKAAPKVNVGWLVFAAWLADFLLGIFAAMGWEHAHAPANYASLHYLTFTFPYSHGLVSLLLWAALFGLLVSRWQKQDGIRAFIVLAALVVSHFFLDGLVHVVGLPLAAQGSPTLGLGLWQYMPQELALESAMAAVGIVVYLWVSIGSPLWSRLGIIGLTLIMTVVTWGQLFLNVPPTTSQLVPSWILTPLLFSAAIYALDRKRVPAF